MPHKHSPVRKVNIYIYQNERPTVFYTVLAERETIQLCVTLVRAGFKPAVPRPHVLPHSQHWPGLELEKFQT
jgi:hypothetical protein